MNNRLLTILMLLIMIGGTLFAETTPRTLYVINGLGRTVSKMNLENAEITNDFFKDLGEVSNKLRFNNGKIYVVNSTPASIMVFDVATNNLDKTILLEAGSNPMDMAFVDDDKIYVSNLLGNSVSVIELSTETVLKTIPVNTSPGDILVVNNIAYVASSGGSPDYATSSVSAIDIALDSVTKVLDMPLNAQGLALAPDGNVHVACTGNYGDVSGEVVVIDPLAGLAGSPAAVDTIEIGGAPGNITITENGKAYLGDWGDGTNGFLYAYNTSDGTVLNGGTNPIRIGNGVLDVYYDAVESVLYASNFADDKIQKIDTAEDTVLATYQFGDGAQNILIVEEIITTSVAENKPGLANDYTLKQNYPNPFNPSTKIEFATQSVGHVEIIVYTVTGQKIKTLLNESFASGNHSVYWDGRNDLGQDVASGIYMYVLKAGSTTITKRMVLVR
jgi:YVTN family beta-propeller protein